MKKLKNIEKLILSILTVAFLAWSTFFIYKSSFIAIDGQRYFCLFDDAMISMRYAWNFSHGLGLVWNSGIYIQGYTNLLMVLLMSFTTLFLNKIYSVLSIQIIGIFIMIAIAYVCMNISTYVFNDGIVKKKSFFRILIFFCSLAYYPLAYWTLMGMETGLLTLLLLSGLLFAFKYIESRKNVYLFLVSIYLGLAFLTRNDSIIYSALIWFYIIQLSIRKKTIKKDILNLSSAITLLVVFVLTQLIFQFFYYGELLPNTFVLKLTGMPLRVRIVNGIKFVIPFIKSTFFSIIISGLDLIYKFSSRKLLIFSIFISSIFYQIYVGGDPWVYWRMMSPFMSLLFMLFINAIFSFVRPMPNHYDTNKNSHYRKLLEKRKFYPQILIILFIVYELINVNKKFYSEILFLKSPYYTSSNYTNVNIAIVLNQLTNNNASVGVFWAGSIPYYTDKKAIDFLGKSDKYIANLPPDLSGATGWGGMNSVPGHNKYDLHYSIKTLLPTYVQGFTWGNQDLSQWANDYYTQIYYKGVNLYLLNNASEVNWNLIYTP